MVKKILIFTSILVLICTIGFKGEESVVKSNHDKIVIEGNTYAYDLNDEDPIYEYIGVSVTIMLKYEHVHVYKKTYSEQLRYFKELKDNLVSKHPDFFNGHNVNTSYADSFIQLSYYEDMNMIYALIENSKIHLDEAITMVGISKSYKSGTLNTSSPEDVIDAGGGTINNLPQIYETINVKAAMQNGHTGINVKVGVIELKGIHDYESDTFSHKNLGIDTFIYGYSQFDPPVINQHATDVSRIIVGSDGIAPEAELFIAHFRDGETTSNYPQGILEWFRENNVDLVNMSYGVYIDDTSPNSNIHSTLLKYNEITYYSNLILIAGLGNISSEPTSHKIPIPASALNVIAVGGTNTNGSEMYANNAYQKPNGYSYITKPTVVAPTNPFGSVNGTSFSAPLVTGALALYIDSHRKVKSDYSLDNLAAYTLLTASANFLKYKNKPNNIFTYGFEKQYGAGLLDVSKLMNISQNSSGYNMSHIFEKEFLQSTQALRFTFITFTNLNSLQDFYSIEVYRKSRAFGNYNLYKYTSINYNNTLIIDLDEFVNYQYKIIIRNTKNVTGGRYFVSYSYFTSQYKPPKDGPIPVM